MKKALVVFLILALAGGVFAQVSWSGAVETGATFTFTDDYPVEMDDNDGHAVKSRLSVGNTGDDWGVTVQVNADRNQDDTTTTGHVFGNLNGWVKFGGGMFKLTAGNGGTGGGGWQATTWKDWAIGASHAGARLNITPISGLDFGIVLGFPKAGVKAAKIGNFFQETGIGAKYDAGIFVAGTQFKLFSEETTGSDMDATWWLDAKVPLSILTVEVETRFQNLLEKNGTLDKFAGLKLSGDVVGLNWNVYGTTSLADEFDLAAGAGLSYEIPINDKASAEVGADADLTVLKSFNFDSWDVYAQLNYKFTSNVSSWAKFEVDGDLVKETLTPFLQLYIKYSF